MEIDFDELDVVQVDVESAGIRKGFDTVIMNPPFGTRTKGADVAFLQKALSVSGLLVADFKTFVIDNFVTDCRHGLFSSQNVDEELSADQSQILERYWRGLGERGV